MDAQEEPKSASYHDSERLKSLVFSCTPVFGDAYVERKFKAIVEQVRENDGAPATTRIPSPCHHILRDMLADVGVLITKAHSPHCNYKTNECTCDLVGSAVFSVIWQGENKSIPKISI
jgi:hypothetical protein